MLRWRKWLTKIEVDGIHGSHPINQINLCKLPLVMGIQGLQGSLKEWAPGCENFAGSSAEQQQEQYSRKQGSTLTVTSVLHLIFSPNLVDKYVCGDMDDNIDTLSRVAFR